MTGYFSQFLDSGIRQKSGLRSGPEILGTGTSGSRRSSRRSATRRIWCLAGCRPYHGSAQHLRGWEERRQAIAQAAEKAARTRDVLARGGLECPAITGAFEFESASGVYTELQCGSYIFMDADYGRNLDRDGAPTKAF